METTTTKLCQDPNTYTTACLMIDESQLSSSITDKLNAVDELEEKVKQNDSNVMKKLRCHSNDLKTIKRKSQQLHNGIDRVEESLEIISKEQTMQNEILLPKISKAVDRINYTDENMLHETKEQSDYLIDLINQFSAMRTICLACFSLTFVLFVINFIILWMR